MDKDYATVAHYLFLTFFELDFLVLLRFKICFLNFCYVGHDTVLKHQDAFGNRNKTSYLFLF
ncbi:hypothetical protein QF004_001163 [Chryseobacterium sp. MDT2-18]|uniref:Uncharacterized protein n=1 Tax=Chryseobacterium salivictor TaxID=2547600 RepID=A0A4P6ZDN9_9FLAO|nr:hypothetical protein [Chryseobacterium sp. MDT2-18]QBO57555.1 hypothetical protein NBC122_00720 [Chryseobacterium salivictor]